MAADLSIAFNLISLRHQALEAGASGYLTKRSAPQVLIGAVRRILAGHAHIEQPFVTRSKTVSNHQTIPRRHIDITEAALLNSSPLLSAKDV